MTTEPQKETLLEGRFGNRYKPRVRRHPNVWVVVCLFLFMWCLTIGICLTSPPLFEGLMSAFVFSFYHPALHLVAAVVRTVAGFSGVRTMIGSQLEKKTQKGKIVFLSLLIGVLVLGWSMSSPFILGYLLFEAGFIGPRWVPATEYNTSEIAGHLLILTGMFLVPAFLYWLFWPRTSLATKPLS